MRLSIHPNYSVAVAIISRSILHYHRLATEEYEVIKGELTVTKENKRYQLKQGDKIVIKAGTIHSSEGEQTWVRVISKPGWTLKDHVLFNKKKSLSKIVKPKLFIIDLDGTVTLNRFTPPTPRVNLTLRFLVTKARVSLCTGRNLDDTKELILKCNLQNNYHILESGTKVLNPKGNYEYIKTITKKEVKDIMKLAEDLAVDIGICCDGKWEDNLDNVLDDEAITICSLNSDSQGKTEKILSRIISLSNKFTISVGSHSQFSKGAHIHVTSKEASKGFGVRYIQRKLQIPKQETAGVGDMPNDLSMLLECGTKVAMGNADTQVVAIADFMLPPVDEEGFTSIVDRFF